MKNDYKKKLIEVALPLEDINREAAREKSIRHGHPSTLHLWWARRPLAACRAVLFSSLVDDPSERVEELMGDATKRKAAEKVLASQRKAWEARKAIFDQAEAGGVPVTSNPPPGPEPRLEDILVETERERLFNIIRELVKWENSNNERVLNSAREEIRRSCRPRILKETDDFLEMQKEAIRSDLYEKTGLDPNQMQERVAPIRDGFAKTGKWKGSIEELRLTLFLIQRETKWAECDAPEREKEFRSLYKEVRRRWNEVEPDLPPVYDPFCGGGSIPLEAQRLGLEAHASDLNPVPVLITKALIEIPPKFAGKPPVNPEAQRKVGSSSGSWKGAAGLAEDIRYYGQWMRDEAEKRIGHLYPKVKLPKEQGGGKATVIAWIWARTVASPNPAAKGAHVPLVRSFWLSTKAGRKAWVEPIVDHTATTYRFEVHLANGEPRAATISRNGGVCLFTGSPMPLDYIRTEGKAGRMGSQLMGVVADGPGGRIYLSPSHDHQTIAESALPPERIPDTEMVTNSRYMTPTGYGMTKHHQLFTKRQLVALATFCDLVEEARATVAALPNGSASYADAIATYLAFAVSKGANYWSSICKWHQGAEKMVSTFGLPVLPMAWDYTEANPFSDSSGNWSLGVEQAAKSIAGAPASCEGYVFQADARQPKNQKVPWMVSTDPPYYDNVPYADLSDLFYIWLRRTLQNAYPELLSTVLVPKTTELVADPFRQGGKAEAQSFFERGLGEVFRAIRQESSQTYPFTAFYAFKQQETAESNADHGGKSTQVSTGWETMLEALVSSGFSVNGTWPMRTEQSGGLREAGRNSLASSIVLVCRPRYEDASMTSRRDFLAALKRELPEALRNLQKGNIAPVDLAQAAIGPGMAVFSRYARVLETDGSPMNVRTALALINRTLDEVLAEQEGEFDADTRWALAWFEQYGFEEGPYGAAETLSTAKNTSVRGMEEAGIVAAKSGKVRLKKKGELAADWDPGSDPRLTIWESTHHLVRALDQGEQAAAELLRKLGPLAEISRDLSYRLYTVCERKKWAQEAIGYNALVQSWPDLTRLAQELKTAGPSQGEFL